jgi:hypothetical protein
MRLTSNIAAPASVAKKGTSVSSFIFWLFLQASLRLYRHEEIGILTAEAKGVFGTFKPVNMKIHSSSRDYEMFAIKSQNASSRHCKGNFPIYKNCGKKTRKDDDRKPYFTIYYFHKPITHLLRN